MAAGNVINQRPTSGTSIAAGSSVNLVVSSGPPPVSGSDDVNLVNLTVPAQVTARSADHRRSIFTPMLPQQLLRRWQLSL